MSSKNNPFLPREPYVLQKQCKQTYRSRNQLLIDVTKLHQRLIKVSGSLPPRRVTSFPSLNMWTRLNKALSRMLKPSIVLRTLNKVGDT